MSVTFIAAIFFASTSFVLHDGWIFFLSRWIALGCGMTFFTAFFLGLIPTRELDLESKDSDTQRANVLIGRTQHFTQWQIKYDHLPKS